jgi:hypothetical protein
LKRFLSAAFMAASVLLAAPAAAQDSASLASKSIAQVHAVQNRIFAFAEGGASWSRLNLFGATPAVVTFTWPWEGGAEGGAPWGSSLLLRANYWVSDSQRVARVTSLRYAGSARGGDSLIFRDPTDTTLPLADGARLTALAVRDSAGTSVAALGFGKLGVAYARLAPENGTATLTATLPGGDTLARFVAFPSASDTARLLYTCRWNRLCRVDTLSGVPALDSVIAIAVDSSHVDTTWLLIATQKGLRRGRWGDTLFPYITLPGIDSSGTAVRSVFTSPSRNLAWAFTSARFFFSDDHGASFRRVPDTIPGISFHPSSLGGYSEKRPPHAAFSGDTTFINFNRASVGLILFRRDTILANAGLGEDAVLLNAEDGLDLRPGEGDLTALAVAQEVGNAGQRVLVAGSTIKGVFFLRLDQPGTTFTNINRLKVLKGGLQEVITYPTLLSAAKSCGDAYVRIGYRLKKDARVSITVYNYAMEKVRVVRRNAARRGGIARSENIAEDRWDGCDESGRFVSVGTYYILVESDQGEKAFGKAIVTRGRK